MDIVPLIRSFFARYPLRTFARRELLLRAEEPVSSVFYIVEGHVSQYDIAPSGNEVVVNVFKPGAFFPMSAVINGTPNAYFFEASTEVAVHVAPKVEVLAFVRTHPEVQFDLLARVYRGTDGIVRRMAHLMGGDAKSRLLFELLNAAYRFGELQPDGAIHVPLTESDLARHSGLARETISRVVRDLKKAGLLEVAHNSIIITHVDMLEAQLGADL